MSSPSSAPDMDMEDGEIRKSPVSKEPSLGTLSLTDEEEMMDNLEIKPPQARVHKSHRKSKHSASAKRHPNLFQVTSSEHRKKHHHSRTHREDRHRHHRERKEDRSLKEHAASLSNSRRHEMRREEREKAKEEARVVVLMEEQQRREEKRREDELRSRAAREERRAEKEVRRVEREERRAAVREERRFERDIKDMLEQHRSQQAQTSQLDGETSKEREEQEIRRQRLMEAERVKETYRKDMEERRARREQRERSRSRERKLEAEQAERQAEMERAGLVVVSDESRSSTPEGDEEGEIHTPVGQRNGGESSAEEEDGEHRRRHHSSSRESTCSESDESEEEEEEEESSGVESEHREATPPKPPTPTPAPDKSPVPSLPPYLPAIMGCRSVEEFHCLNRIEEGTYGVVYRAKDKRTEEIVALKRLKMEKEKQGFPITSLREINTLLKAQHPNIVCVKEIVVGSNMDKIFIVMDYVEHDLKSLMETMKQKKQAFVPGEVKCLMKQLLAAVAHLHDNWILHRDLKTSNLLLSHKGILRVGDFGLAREYGSPLKQYTSIVVTLWYRAPELLLGIKEYSTPIDMWSVGCIFAELLTMEPLFTGRTEVDQLNRIFKALGTPNERIWSGYSKLPAVQKMTFTEFPISTIRNRFTNLSELGLSLLNGFLTYNPSERMTAEGGLKHGYFSEVPLPIDPAMFPTWPAKSEPGHHRKKIASPKPPSGGRAYKQLEDTDEGFHMGQVERNRINLGPGFSLKF